MKWGLWVHNHSYKRLQLTPCHPHDRTYPDQAETCSLSSTYVLHHLIGREDHIWPSYTWILIYEHHIPAMNHIHAREIESYACTYDVALAYIWWLSLIIYVLHIPAGIWFSSSTYMLTTWIIYGSHIQKVLHVYDSYTNNICAIKCLQIICVYSYMHQNSHIC